MTGLKGTITRGGMRMAVDVDEMSDDELEEWAHSQANDTALPPYRGWTTAAALAAWIREAAELSRKNATGPG